MFDQFYHLTGDEDFGPDSFSQFFGEKLVELPWDQILRAKEKNVCPLCNISLLGVTFKEHSLKICTAYLEYIQQRVFDTLKGDG